MTLTPIRTGEPAGPGEAEPPVPTWLRSLLGDAFFSNVVSVTVSDDFSAGLFPTTEAEPEDRGSGNPTDTLLESLKALKQLRKLQLAQTNVTDVGLAHIKGLTGLEELDLRDTKITDAGLVYLKGLNRLQFLNLTTQR